MLLCLTNFCYQDFHLKFGKIFWIDSETNSIVSSSVPTSNDRLITLQNVFSSSSSKGLQCFAVDWVHNNLYWTDENSLSISAISLQKNTEVIDVISENLRKPQTLLVNPLKYLLFWVDLGDHPR